MNKPLVGNAIVGQSGGPTSAINATLAGVIRGCMQASEIKKLYGAFHGVEGILAGNVCDLTARIKGEGDLTLLSHTPAAALGSCRVKLPAVERDPATYEKLFAFFESHNIRYFFYIGGNDSMDTVAKLSAYAEAHDYEIRVMGVPKTIDNDLVVTDHTPGYGSAAKFIATSVQEMIRDCAVYTVKAVTIVEIMGRDAGWLTAAAALPSIHGVGPDLVYLPERAFDVEQFYVDVQDALARHPNVVVAVSEGLRFADGTYVGASSQSGVADVFGHQYLAGTGKALERLVKEKFGCKTRSVELNILQRCAAHIASKTDIEESNRIGTSAVLAALQGVSGEMMTFVRTSDDPYICTISHEKIEKIANLMRPVPDHFINEAGNGISAAGLRYLAPLIVGEVQPAYVDGLPRHIILK